MSQTKGQIAKGEYAYSSHSVFISGDIVDVFIGRWILKEDGNTRILQKFPSDHEVDHGHLMCVLKLRSPIPIDEYREIHHPALRPMVQNLDDDVAMVLLPAEMACTIPDGM